MLKCKISVMLAVHVEDKTNFTIFSSLIFKYLINMQKFSETGEFKRNDFEHN